jgi:hypothetical protein
VHKPLLSLFVAAAVSFAAISDYGARVVQAVNARLDSVPRENLAAMEQAINECDGQLRLLIRDSREPQVRAAQAKLDDLRRQAESMRGNLRAAGKSSEQLEKKVYQFEAEYLRSMLTARARALYPLATEPVSTASLGQDPNLYREMSAYLAQIDQGCKSKYADIAGLAHPNPAVQQGAPAVWCKIAANRDEMLRRSATNAAAGDLSGIARHMDTMKQGLEANEGYLENEIQMVRRALWGREALLKELAARYQPLFAAAGVTDTSAIMAPLQPSMDALMAEATRLAPRWKFPAAGPHEAYPESLAKQQLAKEYPGTSLRASIMTDPVFKIVKNRLGIPLERYRDGSILYKAQNETLCRQQGFTYLEKFDGTGYQRPAGVGLNRIRYLPCQ